MAINQESIVNAIAKAIHEAYPDRPVYINQQEQEFQRPSFFVDVIYWTRNRENAFTDKTILYLSIYCFEKLTVNRSGDLFTATNTANTIEGLFRMETLPVEDRVLKIQASRGNQERGECDVDLIVTWYDLVGYDPDAGYPLMEELHTKMEESEER